MSEYVDRVRGLLAELQEVDWAALTDPGDRKTAPAWIVDAGDIEVRLPATYQAGRLAAFIAEAPAAVAHLLAVVDAQQANLDAVAVLAEAWRYKGEFGWGAWQEGHGPDMEGTILDDASRAIRGAIAEVGQ